MACCKLGPMIAVLGLIVAAAAALVFFVGVPIIIKNKVKEETRLEDNSETYDKWRDVPIPVFLKFNFFNITNPEALENGENLTLSEVGPYVWEEDRYKVINSTNEDEDSITYEEFIIYKYRPDLSGNRSEEETFNMINFPFAAVSTVATKTLLIGSAAVIQLLVSAGEKFVMQNVKVREVVFDGIEVKPIYKTIFALQGSTPPEFEGGRFAFYRNKNNTSDGVYKIKRGIKSEKDFGKIITFEGKKELDWWTNNSLPVGEEQYCNKINGSDGSIFPPFFEKDRIMRIFVLDICRSIYLTYSETIDFHDITGYRFTIPQKMLENPSTNPDNRCFCTDPGAGLASYCRGGLIRIFACKDGAPVITSNPHFLDGDAELYDYLNGLKPDREKHQTTIDVEPRSGQLLRATKRIQINAELQPLPRTSAFNKIPGPSLAVPMFWVEELAELDDKNINDLKDQLIKPLKLINWVQWVAIGAGGAIFILGLVISYFRRG